MSSLSNTTKCAKLTLDKIVCEAISSSVLSYYCQFVNYLRNTLNFDITIFFQVIAILSIICWVQNWLLEIIKFICKIPKIIKNILCGKFNLCILDCENSSHSAKSSKSSKSSVSKCSSECESFGC